MSAEHDPPFPGALEDDLSAHGAFLRRLARGLVRDEHDLEDVLQGALVSALRSPDGRPVGRSRVRAWWATIVRNTAHRLHRDRARRGDHERASACERETASTPDVERQIELQEEVLRAVRALREPYRTAIHLRYWADLSPRDIATRLGVPTSTVDTRIARGRALLREKLTEAHGGDRTAWLAGLVPLLRPGDLLPALPVTTVGAWIVGTKLKVLATTTLVAAIAVVAWRSPDVPEEARPAPAVAAPAEEPIALAPTATTTSTTPREVGERRVALPEDRGAEPRPAAAPAEPEETDAGVPITGFVVDSQGARLPAVRVVFEPGQETPAPATPITSASDAAGAFELFVPGGGEVHTDEPDLVTVLAGATEGRGPTDTIVLAARSRTLQVDVVDESGAPLEGVRIEAELPDEFRSRFELALQNSIDVQFSTTTDAEGRAALSALPELPGIRLSARAGDYQGAELVLDSSFFAGGDPLGARFVLEHMAGEETTLAGRVVDASGVGVADAHVALGSLTTRSGAEGRFFFDLSGEPFRHAMLAPEELYDVSAVRQGFLPDVFRPEVDAAGKPLWPDEVLLQPVQPALSIAGRVVDAAGEPLEGWAIFLPNTRLFGTRVLEATIAGVEGGFFYSVASDSRGRFELHGLVDQGYDIAAIDRRTLRRVDAEGVAAGTSDLVLKVPAGGLWERLSGRVVDADGAPVADVLVQPHRQTQSASGADGYWSTSMDLEPVLTGEDGAFEFRDLPKRADLSIIGDDIIHRSFDAPASEEQLRDDDARELTNVEVEVVRRLHFQVVLDDPAEADQFAILDGNGEEMFLYAQTPHMYVIRGDDHKALTEGRSRHLFVEEGAAEIALLRDGVELRRVPIALEPGDETLLRL